MNHGIARFSGPLLHFSRPALRRHRSLARPVEALIVRLVQRAEPSV